MKDINIKTMIAILFVFSTLESICQNGANFSTQNFSNYTESTNNLNIEMVAVKGGKMIDTIGWSQETVQKIGIYTESQRDYYETVTGDTIYDVKEREIEDFYIGKYEITVEQFKNFIASSGFKSPAKYRKAFIYKIKKGKVIIRRSNRANWNCDVSGKVRPLTDNNHPVILVFYFEAEEFCKWLSDMTGKDYRIPTEAEWKFAASGGNKSNNYIFSGSNNIDEVAWYSTKDGTHCVGLKKPNELGIYDMTGNVREMCSDYHYKVKSLRQANGGGWNDPADVSEIKMNSFITFYCSGSTGFRIACSSKK